MARTFVFSDNLAARVEIVQDPLTGFFAAYCGGCGRGGYVTNLVDDCHERFCMEDTQQVAELHADRCQRCADPECRNTARHDSGHRCRKP